MVESSSSKTTGDGSGANSALRAKIAELFCEVKLERLRQFVEQSQAEFLLWLEVEKYQRHCSYLQDQVARLEEDCDRLRKWMAKDQEIINLMEAIVAKQRDFIEKFIKMKKEIWDLECGKNRGVAEVVKWRKRCEELAKENSTMKEGEIVVAGEVDEEMPMRNEGHLSTSERKRSSEFLGFGKESESMGEDGCDGGDDVDERIPLRQLKKRRVNEVGDGTGRILVTGEPEDGDAEPAGTGNTKPIGPSGELADLQIPSTGNQEVYIKRASQGPNKKVDGNISKEEVGAAKWAKTTGIGNARDGTSLRIL